MRACRTVFALGFLIAAAAAHGQDAAPLSLHDFRTVLQQTRSALQQPAKSNSPFTSTALPDQWTVRDGGREFHVSTEWLRDGLRTMQQDPAKAQSVRESLLAKINALDAQAEDAGAAADIGAERGRLAAILARREFGAVHGPSVWDHVRQWINNLLMRLFSRIFGSQAVSDIGSILVWLVIVGALGVLGWWARRLFLRRSEMMTIAAAPPTLEEKDWRMWLRDARSAATARQWREAIHHAYWAGVYALEARGVWRSDRARTPREYLRELEQESPYRPSLQSLTSVFERTWYAGQEADAAAFEVASQSLEKLECR